MGSRTVRAAHRHASPSPSRACASPIRLTAPPLACRSDLGKIHYLKQRYGTAEALGQCQNNWERPQSAAQSSKVQMGLRPSPSSLELQMILQRRSRARGRGGVCSHVADVVHPKWNVLYRGTSAASISMKPTG